MVTLPGNMAPGWLGWEQGLATWHQGGLDGNRAWPLDTRVAGMATGTCHLAPEWLVWLQCPAAWHQGGWDGNTAWPHGTREAVMATGPGHMAPGRLGWHQGLATWHQGGLYGYIARRHGTRVDGNCNRALPHGTREAGMATGPGQIAPG